MFSDLSGMKLEINNRRRIGKLTNMLKLNNILFNNQGIKKITKHIRKFFQVNGNVYTTFQNLGDEIYPALGGKFIVVNAYIKKENLK